MLMVMGGHTGPSTHGDVSLPTQYPCPWAMRGAASPSWFGFISSLNLGALEKKKKYSPAGVFLINLRLFCTK